MENVNDNTPRNIGSPELPVSSAVEMSPLQLNGIRLDVNHTILTPDYLEQIKAKTQVDSNKSDSNINS